MDLFDQEYLNENGFQIFSQYLDKTQQLNLLDTIKSIKQRAPFYRPTMPKSNKPFSVQITSCGAYGWVADQKGYRYEKQHPVTKQAWPAMPSLLETIWQDVTQQSYSPQSCLINYYKDTAKMGAHLDKDELDLTKPVLSISLGQSAQFFISGPNRNDRKIRMQLNSGDVVIMAGPSRNFYHGIDKILPNKPAHFADFQGRLNLTLRCVT